MPKPTRGPHTIAAQTNFDPRNPFAATHVLDAREGNRRERLRVQIEDSDGATLAYTRDEWEASPWRAPAWQRTARGEWSCPGWSKPAVMLRPVDAPPAERDPAVYTTQLQFRCSPEQRARWQAAAKAAGADSLHDWLRRELDEAAGFALRHNP